jgi:hypothetical protein
MGPGYNTCEIIDLESLATSCRNLPDLPTVVYKAIGGLGLNKNPIICGGFHNKYLSKNCYALENKVWISSFGMNSERSGTEAVQLQNGKILVTGGQGRNSAEILTEEGWKSNIPSLPESISEHCMVTVNSTTVLVIAGRHNGGDSSERTYYFTLGEEKWTDGPSLNFPRFGHSCGEIRRDKESQEMSIIVAGGFGRRGYFMSSVEILHTGSNEWQKGPELPNDIAYSQMVKDKMGGVVLIGGSEQFYDTDHQDDEIIYDLENLYQLQHGGPEAVWTKMELKLKTRRNWHTAFMVPDNMVDCL